MAISFTSTMKKVWSYLVKHGMTEAGAAGMMGNMYAESGIIPNRVEILCLQRLKEAGQNYTDKTYTAAVDSGKISKAEFLNPLPGKQYGYGFCQWTSPGRKEKLYDLAKKKGASIGDRDMQLEFLISELKASYKSVWKTLSTTKDVLDASNTVLVKFEIPADTGSGIKQLRYGYSKEIYGRYKGITTPAKDTQTATTETAKPEAKPAEKIKTEEQAINMVISLAEEYVGYHEKASAKNLNSKTANSGYNDYTIFGKEMHEIQPSNMDYPAAWCDCFVDWLFYKCFGVSLAKKMLCGNFDDYTVNSANYYRGADRWFRNGKRGDQIFFQDYGGICHTGIVTDVVGGYVYTIEGNSSDAVCRRTYAAYDGYIAGYGRPKYNLAVGTDAKDPDGKKPADDSGGGSSGAPSTTVKWAGMVTADVLNVRTWAGTEYPNIKSVPVLYYGQVVSVCDIVNAEDGTPWYFILINGSVYGFVCSTYIKRI